MVIRALAGLLVLIFAGQVFAEACNLRDHDLGALPGSGNGPVEIDIRLYLNDLTEIEDAQQSFVSDVFIRAEWMDSRLVHSGLTPCTVDDSQIWTPGLMLLNRRVLERVYDPELSVAPDGRVIRVLRAYGEFTFQADLSNFPFDHQELYFTLISKYEVRDVKVVTSPQKLGMAEHLSVANWQIQLGGSRSSEHYIAPVDRTISRLDVVFQAQRLTGFYTWQLLVPLFLVVMMTWTVFWIPHEFVPPRVGLVATAMLTLIAYRFAIASILPPIAYLTRLDKFMVASSVLVFAALAAVVAVTYFDGRGSKVQALWLNKASRALAPLLFMIVFIKVFLM
jgi:gamma-aminobutyric acid receptor subunit beta